MTTLASFLAGLLFGLGLLVSGMSDPAKVLGFLDLAGRWDPSLALVMVGAIGVGLPAFAIAKRRERALLGEPMRLPTSRTLDRPLILGALLFGIGWGVAGFCPGPALVTLSIGGWKVWAFVAAMLVGMAAVDGWGATRMSAWDWFALVVFLATVIGFVSFSVAASRTDRQKLSALNVVADEQFRRLKVDHEDERFRFDGSTVEIVTEQRRVTYENDRVKDSWVVRYCRNPAGEYFHFVSNSSRGPYIKHVPQSLAKIALKKRYRPPPLG